MKKKGQLFFYRLEPSRLLSALIRLPEDQRGTWVTQFAIDLENGVPTSDLAAEMIKEAKDYSKTKKAAAIKRWEAKQVDAGVLQVHTGEAFCNASSSNSNKTDKIKRFVPPSLQEVETFITDNNYNVEPAKWINYYEANGWKVGRNKMVDWKAAVRTWHNKASPKQIQPQQQRYF